MTGFLTAGWFLVDLPVLGLPSVHALKLLEKNPEESRGLAGRRGKASSCVS